MYVYSIDETECVAVSAWFGAASDADYEQAIAQTTRLDQQAAARGLRHVHISHVDRDYPQPSPKWRKRMSEVNRALVAAQYDFVLVSSSRVIRAVVTAVSWLTGSRAGHRAVALGTFAEAAAWVRDASGEAYPQLELLRDRVASLKKQAVASRGESLASR